MVSYVNIISTIQISQAAKFYNKFSRIFKTKPFVKLTALEISDEQDLKNKLIPIIL